ncbi:MAG: class I SAM-dependent methyltransferase [Planctomycetes bacterium]|nr:class I SAM-dependent methyltransferase [Planctomycetota bacterium]
MTDWRTWLGQTDVMLVDQFMRGSVPPGATVLDAGCGSGRNLDVFLREGHPVLAADRDAARIDAVRARASSLGRTLPDDALRVEAVEALSFGDGCAQLVIANAVLHFAEDAAHFDAMLAQLFRVCAPGGLLFARLATTIGIESALRPLGGGRFLQPDGDVRYLVDAGRLLAETARRGAALADPLKTTLVHGQRSMTTWVVRAPQLA